MAFPLVTTAFHGYYGDGKIGNEKSFPLLPFYQKQTLVVTPKKPHPENYSMLKMFSRFGRLASYLCSGIISVSSTAPCFPSTGGSRWTAEWLSPDVKVLDLDFDLARGRSSSVSIPLLSYIGWKGRAFAGLWRLHRSVLWTFDKVPSSLWVGSIVM